ncbi:TetR family transcriptional regulator [Corynebacterium bovis]|uniref:TetR family transcriptional regulator n=1 Tax=Corynebacterium bovis TaxID=36808 RepID=UPI00313999BA
MDTTDLLVIADEVCDAVHTRIRSLSALSAVAAVTHCTVDAIPVHGTVEQRRADVVETVRRMQPLVTHNALFAEVVVALLDRD